VLGWLEWIWAKLVDAWARTTKRRDDEEKRREDAEEWEQKLREADAKSYRDGMDHALKTQGILIDDLAAEVKELKAEQKSMAREMMRVKVEHAKCEVRTTNMELEIERLKAALAAKGVGG
jgi:mannitol-1-phosphate/altronate dehydrogenase